MCLETDKFIDEKTCLICDNDFDTTSKVAQHIKKDHLSIITIQTSQVQNAAPDEKQSVKVEHTQEMIDLNKLGLEVQNVVPGREQSIKVEHTQEMIDLENLGLEVQNVVPGEKQSIKVEHTQEIIDLENVSMETDPLALEPEYR